MFSYYVNTDKCAVYLNYALYVANENINCTFYYFDYTIFEQTFDASFVLITEESVRFFFGDETSRISLIASVYEQSRDQ